MTKTHKASGWTREALGFGEYWITPTDGSGERRVLFLSAGTWQNTAGDRREDADRDRVIQTDGPPLPRWALSWLLAAQVRQSGKAREQFHAMLDQADWDESRHDGW